MESFLHQIARAYIENEADELLDYCFVFPNKRSVAFFNEAVFSLMKETGKTVVPPAASTITDLVEGWYSQGKRAERMEMVFLLYQTYRRLMLERLRRPDGTLPENAAQQIDFNRFQFWADMLIADFNDVDMNLVDASQLFKNLKSLKNLQANYLTDRQIKALERYFSTELPLKGDENDNLWHQDITSIRPDQPKDAAKKPVRKNDEYVRLWEVMFDLYNAFRHDLEGKNIFYPGMAYRWAVDTFPNRTGADFKYKRYIFVGFNNLTKSEWELFKIFHTTLRDPETTLPLGDFYWDVASPVFNDPEGRKMRLSRKMRKYVKDFPSIYADYIKPITEYPEIEVVGVASQAVEGKVAAKIVGSLFPSDKPIDQEQLRNTAIILPKETTYNTLLHSLADNINPINLTMGFSLRNTQVATLMRSIVSMQLRARASKTAGFVFFHEDVRAVLSNALLRMCVGLETCNRLVLRIDSTRTFNVPISWFDEAVNAPLRPVFQGVAAKAEPEKVFDYLTSLLAWLSEKIYAVYPEQKQPGAENVEEAMGEEEEEEEETSLEGIALPEKSGLSASGKIQWAFIEGYREAVEKLRRLVRKYLGSDRAYLEDTTVYSIVERMVAGEKLNFEGEPLVGLQIMGVLEARAIDFDRVIIPNMNEKIFPRRRRNKSLIPNNLRSAFGMTTSRHRDIAFNYYFYRMISRAKQVWLIYDTRTGTRSGPMSRYIAQLLYLFRPKGMTWSNVQMRTLLPVLPELTVEKTPEIMERIERYFSEGEEAKSLSASAINLYLECPLSFYFTYLADYQREDDNNDFIDASTFGTAIHDGAQGMYDLYASRLPDRIFTPEILDKMKRDTDSIGRFLQISLNKNYHHLKPELQATTPLQGDSKAYATILAEYIRYMFERDKANAPFRYDGSEVKDAVRLHLAGLSANPAEPAPEMDVNFTYRIDRLDTQNPGTPSELQRLVDYKTGDDDTSFSSIDMLFPKADGETSGAKRRKAILQLLLYCQAFSQRNGQDKPIKPLLYRTRDMASKAIASLTFNRKPVTDFRPFIPEMNQRLIEHLADLRNPHVPFQAPKETHQCAYCKFIDLCQRKEKRF